MTITATQLEVRRKSIGSSDVAALLGQNPYRTAYDLYLDKTGQLKPEPATNDAIELGILLEAPLLKYAGQKIGLSYTSNQRRVAKDLPIAANIDAVTKQTTEPIEAKTAGLMSPFGANDEWGEAGTDEVPSYVILQAQTHILCMGGHNGGGPDRCHVVAFLGGRGPVMFEVKKNPELIKIIIDRCVDFWENNVKKEIPPEKTYPTGETLARVIRRPRESVAIDPQLLLAWRAAKETEKSAKKDVDTRRIELLTALGGAEIGETPEDGDITYLEQSRKSIDTKSLLVDFPELINDYQKETTFRVARYRKAKGG